MNNTPIKKSEQWIHPLSQREGGAIELICFPFAGGGIQAYRPWEALLSPQINLNAVLMPGREIRIRQAPERDIDKICDAIVNEVISKYVKKTLVFFGHSMGALLAYEVAKRIQQQHNLLLKALIISGRQAPHLYFGGDSHQSPDEAFIQVLKDYGHTPDAIFKDKEMCRLVLLMLRADYSIVENYRLHTPVRLNCPLLTCTGEEDDEVTPEQIQCWQELVSGKTQHQVFSGEHFYFMDPAIQRDLVYLINNFLL